MRHAVVGGGIAGASVAAHLADRTDDPVTLYERGRVAGETTAKSAAFFGYYGGPVQEPMKRYGMARYNEFAADPRADPRYELVGRLRVATSEAGAAGLDAPRAVERLDPGAVHERLFCPALDADALAGATYRPGVGFVRPREFALEFLARAEERGATVREETPVEEVLVEDGRATGVVVDGEREPADHVVLAAGPWTARLARACGLDLPLGHTLAPIRRIRPSDPLPHTLPIVSHAESGVYVRGHEDDTLLVGHHPGGEGEERDPDAVPESVPEAVRAETDRALGELLPPLADAEPVEEWVGVRSTTPDGEPVVGPTAVDALSVVAFHSSGIQLSPAAGDLVARHVAGADLPGYAEAVSPARFGGGD